MKKNIFRLLSVFFLSVAFICASSCSAAAPESFDLNFAPESEKVNLDGFNFNYSINVGETSVMGYNADSIFADVVRVRIDEVENTYNCVIAFNYVSGGGTLFNSIASGSYFCDAIQENSNGMMGLMKTGCLVGISTLSEHIDYTDTFKWGTPNMQEAMFWKDDLYAVLPASWPELLYGNSGYPVLVNENLIASLGATDPREYLEDDSWTWDRLEEVLTAYTTELNGVQIYGMSVHPPYYGEMFMRSNGNKLIEKDDNGNYVCGWYTDSALVACMRGQAIFTETHKDCFYPAEDNATTSAAFINGEAVLYPTWSFYVVGNSALSYQMDNLGLMPFPYGPDADPHIYNSVHEGLSCVISIPINSADVDASAMLINSLYEPLPGYETEEEILAYLSKYDFFDPRDAIVFLNMFKNTQYAFYFEGARGVSEGMTENKSAAQLIESYKSVYDKIFEGTLIPTQNGIDALWGDSEG